MHRWSRVAGMVVAATLSAALSPGVGWAQTVITSGTPCTAVGGASSVPPANQNPRPASGPPTARAQTGPTPTYLDAIAFPTAHLVGSAIPAPGTERRPAPACQQIPGQFPQVVFEYAPGFGYSYGYGTGSPDTSAAPVPAGDGGAVPPTTPAVTNATVPRNTIRDLAQSPDRFDRQVVSVTGVIAAVQVGTTAQGAPYTALTLRDGDAAVGVLVWGRLGLAAGDAVRVSGAFYAGAPPGVSIGPSSLPWVQADLVSSVVHP